MKAIHLMLGMTISALAFSCTGSRVADGDSSASLTEYVNPMVGTGGHGHVFLGANCPSGMVQLGPSQRVQGWDWCSGYNYSDTTLLGFSHTHLSGTGIGDLGDLLVMPMLKGGSYISTFSVDSQRCVPGYYRVVLNDSGIEAELTATNRVGVHRYTFPADADTVYLRVDLGYGIGWDRVVESNIEIAADSLTFNGSRRSTGWANDQQFYFAAEMSKQPVDCYLANDGVGKVAVFAFLNDEDPIELKVGVSPVSCDNARENLLSEAKGRSFNQIALNADKAWNEVLGRVKVETDNEIDKRKFYTALYHTMIAPSVFSDVNGDYRGADGSIYNTDGKFTNYTTLSLWDTYRAAHPLSTILFPEKQNDYAETFINIYRQQGKLPVWHLHGNETDCMIGNPGVIVLSDLLLKGFVSDTLGAYEALKNSSMLDERSLSLLKQYGYIPYDAPDVNESVAKGLEYAIADAAVARVARKLGYEEDAEYFEKRSKGYMVYFDPTVGFMRGKGIDGKFRNEIFDPFATSHRADDYCEGNGWQYTWLVSGDPDGLINLFGGPEQFTAKLDSLFIQESILNGDASPDISGFIGQYAHGNEPGHHILYLYNYVGQPEKGAPLLRQVMSDLYSDAPDGLCGNEDVGQMSAWFVMSSMGLYQVEPAGGKLAIGTPLFDSVKIEMPSGKSFEIVAKNNSPENIYVKSARLNGVPHDRNFIDFSEIQDGGTLELEMVSAL